MKTLNVSDETKEIFERLRLESTLKKGKLVSQDEFMKILINNYKEVLK
jgi:hypothetical protein